MILGSFSLVHFDIFDQSKYRQFFPEERKLTICCFLQDFEDLLFPGENLFLSLLAQDRRIFFVRLLFPGRSPVSHVLQHLSFFIKKMTFFVILDTVALLIRLLRFSFVRNQAFGKLRII